MNILLLHCASRLVALAVAASAVIGSGGSAGAADGGFSTIDDFVDAHRAATGTPGLAYAVVGARGIEHERAFGADGDGAPVDRHTPFLWGSVSKPIAATLALGLVRAGEIALDDRVVDLLPEFRVGTGADSSRITVRQLLDHTSGLPPALQVTDRDEPDRAPADGVRELRDVTLLDEPGHEHHYSSANYLVLSAVVEEVTGRPYAEVLAQRVLDPLGMSGVITASGQAREDLPPGHRYLAGRSVAFDSPYDPAGLAYGYLAGTIEDLARFARAQLGGDPAVVADADRALMHGAVVATGNGGSYGLGWRQGSLEDFDLDVGTRIVWHSGAAPGYQSAIIMLPQRRQAVVMLQNSYGFFQEDGLLDASVGVAAILAGSEPPPAPRAGAGYPAVLVVLAVMFAAFGVASVRGVIRLRQPRVAQPWRRALTGHVVVVVLCGVAAYVLAVVLPGSAGMPLRQIPLWAPDVGWLAAGGASLAATTGALRLAVAAREATCDRLR